MQWEEIWSSWWHGCDKLDSTSMALRENLNNPMKNRMFKLKTRVVNDSKERYNIKVVLFITVGLSLGVFSNPVTAAHSVVSSDGSFEEGSLDTELRVAVTPSSSVTHVECFKGGIGKETSLFYILDINTEKRVQRGERGKRTSHVIKQTISELIVILFIANPTDEDEGDYYFILYFEKNEKPAKVQTNLSKRVALELVTGRNASFIPGAYKTSLKISMFPFNAHFNWIRCFLNTTPNPGDYFYTYDDRNGKITAKGDMGRRTRHSFAVKDNKTVFSLHITNPTEDDTGPVCCQIDATGHVIPTQVVVWIYTEDKVQENQSITKMDTTVVETSAVTRVTGSKHCLSWTLFIISFSVNVVFFFIIYWAYVKCYPCLGLDVNRSMANKAPIN